MITATALTLLAGLASFAAPAWWEGEILFREARLAVRIAFDGEGRTARLDIPDLVYAGEPIPVERSGTEVTIELPFGIGEFSFDPSAPTVTVVRAIGEERMTLRIAPAKAPPYRTEEIVLPSGDLTLAGRLVLPDGAGPHPAAVILHGSTPQGLATWAYRSWADLLARRGTAVLIYDKRGVGSSQGSWQDASFDDLVGDALAGVAFLRGHEAIDPDRVGIKAASQGGWLAILAASRSPHVAFLILTSAPAVAPWKQEMQSVDHRMRRDGHTDEAIQDAMAYLGLYFYTVRTGEGWRELKRAARAAASRPWGEYVDQPRRPADLAWWRLNHAWDPRGPMAAVRVPVIALYGGADPIVPPLENAPLLEALMGTGGTGGTGGAGGDAARDVTVHVFEGADHRLEVPPGRDGEGRWHWFGIAPGAIDRIDAWLAARGF